MSPAWRHLQGRAVDLARSPTALITGGCLTALTAIFAAPPSVTWEPGIVVLRLFMFTVWGAAIGPLVCAVEAEAQGPAPTAHPGLPIGDRSRALIDGLAWSAPLALGGLFVLGGATLGGLPIEAPLESGIRGVLALSPLLVLSAWQGRRPERLASLPGVALGWVLTWLSYRSTPQLAAGVAGLLVVVVVTGPWLVDRAFGMPAGLLSIRGRVVGPTARRCPGPLHRLRLDTRESLWRSPLQLLPAVAASCALVVVVILILLLAGKGAGLPGLRDAGLALAIAAAFGGLPALGVTLVLAPIVYPLAVPLYCSGRAGRQPERLARTWERLPLPIRRVRLAVLAQSLAVAVGVAAAAWLALAVLSDRPIPLHPPLLIAAGWGAFFPALQLGDRVTRITAGAAAALVTIALLGCAWGDELAWLDTLLAACAATATVLPLLLLRDTPART